MTPYEHSSLFARVLDGKTPVEEAVELMWQLYNDESFSAQDYNHAVKFVKFFRKDGAEIFDGETASEITQRGWETRRRHQRKTRRINRQHIRRS